MNILDYSIIGIYLLAMLYLGGVVGKKQKNTEDYFLAGRGMRWWPVAISLFASLFSAISYIAMPGEAFNFGLNMTVTSLTAIIALPGSLYIFLKFFYNMKVFTINEYLERRFSPSLRVLNGCLFMLMRLVYLGVVLYATAMLMERAMGLPMWVSVLIIGGISTIYTVTGGMEAVVWTDVAQFVVLLGGIFLVIALIAWKMDGGLAGIWSFAAENHRTFDLGRSSSVWGFSPTQRIAVWLLLFNVPMAMMGVATDQINLQRCLSCKNFSSVARAVISSTLCNVPICFLFYIAGLAVYAFFFKLHPELVSANGLPGDQAFCQYISTYLPVGCRGLMVAAVLAAVMSTVDSVENSLATVFVKDVYQRFWKKDQPEEHYLKVAKYVTGLIGVGICVFGICVNLVFGGRNVPLLEVSNVTLGVLGSYSAAFFVLGLLTYRTSAKALWTGVVAALPVSFYMLVPLYLMREPARRVSFMYVGFVPMLVTIAVGYISSFFYAPPVEGSGRYVIWSRWQNKSRVALVVLSGLALLALAIFCVIRIVPA